MSDPHIPYEHLNDALVAAIPALEEAYQRELRWWRGEPPPQHVLFGEILNPHLSAKLAEADEAALRPAFGFLERMAGDVDPRVQDVLRDTVLEHLRDEAPEQRGLAARLMGSATRLHWERLTGTGES